MPNYTDPLGRFGGAAGALAGGAAGGAGGGILGHLSSLLAPLDYPRQALYNVAKPFVKMASGDDTTSDDWLGALPGGAGLLAGALTGGLGAAIPAAIGMGSLAGGAVQGFGKSTGRDAFDAASAEDVANPLLEQLGVDKDSLGGMAGGFALGAATDPLSYAGGIHGLLKGGAKGAEIGSGLGRSYGGRLEGIAQHMGPQYTHDADWISKLTQTPGFQHLPEDQQLRSYAHLAALQDNPGQLAKLQGEIPSNPQILGAGAEALALGGEGGHVVTVQHPSHKLFGQEANLEGVPKTRWDIPELIQAARSKGFPALEEGGIPYRVEHTPLVIPGAVAGDPVGNRLAVSKLANGVEGRQRLNLEDRHSGNFAKTASGDWKVLDPGSVKSDQELNEMAARRGLMPPRQYPINPLADRASEVQPQQGTGVERWLLKAIGAPESIRSELAQATSVPQDFRENALQKILGTSRVKEPDIASSLGQTVSGLTGQGTPDIYSALGGAAQQEPWLEGYLKDYLQTRGLDPAGLNGPLAQMSAAVGKAPTPLSQVPFDSPVLNRALPPTNNLRAPQAPLPATGPYVSPAQVQQQPDALKAMAARIRAQLLGPSV